MNNRIKMIPVIIRDLSKVDPSLSSLFDRCYGPAAFMSNYKSPVAYKKLILQVSVTHLPSDYCLDESNIFI